LTHAPLQFVSPAMHMPEHIPPEQTWPVGHTLPQAPQLFGSLWVAVHTPEQRASPFVHAQLPFWHVVAPVQVVPHPPQLLLSVCSFTHEDPHRVRLAAHVIAHLPLEQTFPMQTSPQVPQLTGSV
jgi:hypothetical protein